MRDNFVQTISMENEATYTGKRVQDTLCLDDDDDICVMHYGFYDILTSDGVTNKLQDGVVNLN